MVDDLLEPLKIYNSRLKEDHKENTIKYFDALVEKSGIDIEANKATIKKYEETKLEEDKVEGLLKTQNMYKTLSLIGIVLLGIGMFASFLFDLPMWVPILITLLCVSGIIGLIILIMKVIGKKIKELQDAHNLIQEALRKLMNEGYSQMEPLNLLYDWNMPADIINMSNSLIHMDDHFDAKKFQYLFEKYGLDENLQKNVSTRFVQSGSILGNPFLLCEDYRQDWYNERYTGSMTITWTERVKTENGYKSVTHSQVLTASVLKPAPVYRPVTYLVYGNDAAPNLVFSRSPSPLSNEDDDKLQYRKVMKEAKKLDKKAEKELMDDDPTTNYQRFGNDEFEVIFGGTDRNNEMEYRLLFTPLAQRNLLDLLKNAEPYGDDFYFDKDKKLNYVQSRHSQGFNYKANPDIFVDFSYERARNSFIEFNIKYFEAFFFDIAPLISIPLYQQTKSKEYIYENEYKANVTTYEQEAMANAMGKDYFKHPQSDTDTILKCETTRSVGVADEVKVTAYGFKRISHVDLVPTLGGDGRTHNVPVEWYEYSPVSQESYMAIEEKDSSRLEYMSMGVNEEFNNTIGNVGGRHYYHRGLFGTILHHALTLDDVNRINSIYKGNSNISNNNDIRVVLKETIEKLRKAQDLTDNSNIANSSSNVQDSNE